MKASHFFMLKSKQVVLLPKPNRAAMLHKPNQVVLLLKPQLSSFLA